ncbi:MAG: ferrous iron transport protein A [Elusimicrobiota bacterium]|nr:ferrous iron transport protein A [Elusimicrobiota bacterium]
MRIKEQPGIIPLSNAELRDYIFIYAYCPDEHFEHKLLEMGFVPGSSLKVLEKTNMGHKSSVLVKIKGSTLALNMQIAENILISPQQ